MSDRMRAIERTSPQVASMDGDDATRRLVARSGFVHLGFIALAAFVAMAISAGSLVRPEPAALGGVALLFLVSLVGGIALSEKRAAALVCLPASALTLGVLVGSGDSAITGAGIPFAAGVLAAEIFALGANLLGWRRLATGLSLLLPAVTTSALTFLLDGTPYMVGPGALLAGCAVATVFSLHARLAEDVLGLRHGADQLFAAALSRWGEGARVLILRVFEVSAQEEEEERFEND